MPDGIGSLCDLSPKRVHDVGLGRIGQDRYQNISIATARQLVRTQEKQLSARNTDFSLVSESIEEEDPPRVVQRRQTASVLVTLCMPYVTTVWSVQHRIDLGLDPNKA
jgi:hypothetical protein